MIRFYFHSTPNPAKIALFLEEAALASEASPVDTSKGEQHTQGFRAINPNGKVPAIVEWAWPATLGKRQRQNLDDFANLRRWFDAVRQRPATLRAYAKGEEPFSSQPAVTEEGKKLLFGQCGSVNN